MSLETEKALFKSRIRSVLEGMKEKYVSEKDFKKAYHAEYNQNINHIVDKFDCKSVYDFLRFQCQDICHCQVHWGEPRIQLLHLEPVKSSPPDSKKKKHKKSNLPKVNHPRVGIINNLTFPKLNPQGFNKGKPKPEGKPLTSLPFYKSNYNTNMYRSAEQLSKFRNNIAESDEEDDNAHGITHFGSMGGPVNGISQHELADYTHVMNEGVNSLNVQEAPKVGNPFDFPALPKTKQKEEEEEAHTEWVVQESETESEDEDVENESYEVPDTTNQFLRNEPQPAGPSPKVVVEEPKAAALPPPPRFEVDLDDAIFRCYLPPVVEDPNFKIPSPMLHFSRQEAAFEIHVSTVQSPHKFYFHYGDQELFRLINKMEKFYSQLSSGDLVVGIRNIQVGLVVAVNSDNTWHRAEVTTKPDDGGYISMFLLDFGTKIRVHITAVRYLPLMFTLEPVKALRGAIIDIRPKYNADKWQPTVNEAFFGMVSNQKLKATIRRFRKAENEFDVQICVCYNMIWYNIGALLVQRGLAVGRDAGENCFFALPLPVSA